MPILIMMVTWMYWSIILMIRLSYMKIKAMIKKTKPLLK